jgi:hypothetical protein
MGVILPIVGRGIAIAVAGAGAYVLTDFALAWL